MIKFFSGTLGLVMLLPFGANAITVLNSQDAEISRLMAEKQRKYAELEKCVKSVKGLTIAGVSTLGLTAGGVALNIAQASKRNTVDKQITSTNSQIEKKKQEIEEKRIKAEQEKAEKQKIAHQQELALAAEFRQQNGIDDTDDTYMPEPAEPDLTELTAINEDGTNDLQQTADKILAAESPLTAPQEEEEEEEIIEIPTKNTEITMSADTIKKAERLQTDVAKTITKHQNNSTATKSGNAGISGGGTGVNTAINAVLNTPQEPKIDNMIKTECGENGEKCPQNNNIDFNSIKTNGFGEHFRSGFAL